MPQKDRICSNCNCSFRGRHSLCNSCRSVDRTCDGCGKQFKSTERYCNACKSVERECRQCGKTYRGFRSLCSVCRNGKYAQKQRACINCGKIFRGFSRKCITCWEIERVCVTCSKVFIGHKNECPACEYKERITFKICIDCRNSGNFLGPLCQPCYRSRLTPEQKTAKDRRQSNARRARKHAAEITGPVALNIYIEIINSGPCVYCGSEAMTVDHIWPLSRGGIEHEDNLVPACNKCNAQKHAKFLTEWDTAKVNHAVLRSTKVTAVLKMQQSR